jgi:predicted phosphodiesterase
MKYSKLLKYNKITHWIFGHTHETYNKKINNIQFICNPRGRPKDFNRLIYNQISVTI